MATTGLWNSGKRRHAQKPRLQQGHQRPSSATDEEQKFRRQRERGSDGEANVSREIAGRHRRRAHSRGGGRGSTGDNNGEERT